MSYIFINPLLVWRPALLAVPLLKLILRRRRLLTKDAMDTACDQRQAFHRYRGTIRLKPPISKASKIDGSSMNYAGMVRACQYWLL